MVHTLKIILHKAMGHGTMGGAVAISTAGIARSSSVCKVIRFARNGFPPRPGTGEGVGVAADRPTPLRDLFPAAAGRSGRLALLPEGLLTGTYSVGPRRQDQEGLEFSVAGYVVAR